MDSDGSLLAFWVGGPEVPRNLLPMIVTRRLRFEMWHWLQRSTGNWWDVNDRALSRVLLAHLLNQGMSEHRNYPRTHV